MDRWPRAIIRYLSNYQKAVMKKEQYFLGIDPGSRVLGYALIDKNLTAIQVGTLQLKGAESEKYKTIFNFFQVLIQNYPPKALGIEWAFYGENVQSMMKLARVQGLLILLAGLHEIEHYEFAPTQIKQRLTGRGHAGKDQVADLISRKIAAQEDLKAMRNDATDALAIAYCTLEAYQRLPLPAPKKKSQFASWSDYLKKQTEH